MSGDGDRSDWAGALLFAAVVMSAVAFAFCAITSTSHWHATVTGPCILPCVVALVASAVLLNRWAASGGDGGQGEAGGEKPCPYDGCHHNHPEEER